MTFKTALLSAILISSLPTSALADGLYMSGGLGLTKTKSQTISNLPTTFDSGTVGALALGTHLTDAIRLEAELSRRAADVDQVNNTGGTGEAMATGILANMLFDLKTDTGLTPYLGLGLGLARGELDGAGSYSGVSLSDADTKLAYQGIAGLSYAVSESTSLFADYRYFAANNISIGTNSGFDFKAQSVMVGLRYAFDVPKSPAVPVATPAPTPQPVAAPQPAKTPDLPRAYLVFFDWNKAQLTAEARQIIAAAAVNADSMNVIRIALTGHADRSGPDAYNLTLSQRRANAVQAELKRLGLTNEEILTTAKGETDPLVNTPDGVREPQNRRVEIVFP